MKGAKRKRRTLRLQKDDLISNIDPIESFILGVEVKIEALGVNDGRHDGGVSFAGKDSAGDVVLGIGESPLAHQGFEADGRESICRGSFFPDFNPLGDNDFVLGRGDGVCGRIGDSNGGGGGETARGDVGVTRLEVRRSGEDQKKDFSHTLHFKWENLGIES